jgi:folate-binding protein YgfZ
MNTEELEIYDAIRENEKGFYEQKRGLIAVWGKEAVQFLNGLITNDVGKLEDNAKMLAAFPNAQGRLLATARVLRQGDKFLFETEAETREKVFQNLFRFIISRVNDFSSLKFDIPEGDEIVENDFRGEKILTIKSFRSNGIDLIVPQTQIREDLLKELLASGAVKISEETQEVLRVENGVPRYGVEWDETTIVPELGIEGLISYNKGCYIGQEIIARIHFRGHVAKQLTGLIFNDDIAEIKPNDEIKSVEGKNAGRVTSAAFSPKLGKTIALAYVRYDYLAEGTELKIGDAAATVKTLPFIE